MGSVSRGGVSRPDSGRNVNPAVSLSPANRLRCSGRSVPPPRANRQSPSCSLHQFVDAVGNALRGFAQLPDAPVVGIALGHVAGPGVVHQPLRERARQHEFALRHRDEGVAQPVEPEPGAAFTGDFAVEPRYVGHVSGPAPGGRKHPAVLLRRRLRAIREAPLEDGGELPSDRKLQRLSALGLLDPEDTPLSSIQPIHQI